MSRKVKIILGVIAGVILTPIMLFAVIFGLMLAALWGIETELDARLAPSRNALEQSGLTLFTGRATDHAVIGGDGFIAFYVAEWYGDERSVHEQIMQIAADSPDWHVSPVTPAEYAAQILVEYAFLLPDTTFDATHTAGDARTFFDADTGLLIRVMADAPERSTFRGAGLTVRDAVVLEMETHGGFHGDGDTFSALIVPENQRNALLTDLADSPDWHEGQVTAAEFAELHRRYFYSDTPELFGAADFDWWFLVDAFARQNPAEAAHHPMTDLPEAMQGERCGRANFTVAVYDEETGLLICYKFDS